MLAVFTVEYLTMTIWCRPAHSLAGADPGFWKGGGRGVCVINWQCAHRRCAPLGGLKACPLGTFEILDAFSCNLVHILSKNYI